MFFNVDRMTSDFFVHLKLNYVYYYNNNYFKQIW